jgi:hypothetical protein
MFAVHIEGLRHPPKYLFEILNNAIFPPKHNDFTSVTFMKKRSLQKFCVVSSTQIVLLYIGKLEIGFTLLRKTNRKGHKLFIFNF